MEMNWDDLRIFLSVARAESLSGAGTALRLDPATVGRRIALLVDAVGAALFAKSPQGYALTEAGQRFLAHAERAEAAMAGAADEARGQGGRLSGQIRIGARDVTRFSTEEGGETFFIQRSSGAWSRGGTLPADEQE